MKVLICLLAFIAVFLAAEAAHAYHGTSFPCSLRVQGTILPVYYDGSPRNNPDGTFYPGDSFYYLVSYSAGPPVQGPAHARNKTYGRAGNRAPRIRAPASGPRGGMTGTRIPTLWTG